MKYEFAMANDVLIIFIFESQTGVWSRVELRHEFGPIYKFHIHMFNYISAGSVHEYRESFEVRNA